MYTCYVDECGCEGFSFSDGSKHWFILGGIVINDDDKNPVIGSIFEYMSEFYVKNNYMIGWKPPHWIDMKNEARTIFANCIIRKPVILFVTLIWKSKMSHAHVINQPSYLYRFALKLMAERVSWYVRDKLSRFRFVLSQTQSIDKKRTINDLKSAIKNQKWSISPVFDPEEIIIRTPKQEAMLCIADAVASSFGNSLNPKIAGKKRGYITSKYSNIFLPKMYRYNEHIFKYGIKIFPSEDEIIEEFNHIYPSLTHWQD